MLKRVLRKLNIKHYGLQKTTISYALLYNYKNHFASTSLIKFIYLIT